MAKKVVRNESHRRKVQRKNERRQFSEELKSGKIDTLVGSTTGKKKKNKLDYHAINESEQSKAPHSFVITRGDVGKYVKKLEKDIRKVMEPYTASVLQMKKSNSIKDLVAIHGYFRVSHLVTLTKPDKGPNMSIGRLPRGPTVYFNINEYTLTKDIRSSLRKQVDYLRIQAFSPLIVLNNFPSGKEWDLTTTMLQNMFPPINIHKVKLNELKRCVLFNYDSETDQIEFRHYCIKVVASGVNRVIKKIVNSKIPNLGKLEDVADIVNGAGIVSESEFSEDENSKVILPQQASLRGVMPSSQSSVRLLEIGPRMSLTLYKIEDNLNSGSTIYNKYVHKTREEIEAIKRQRKKAEREKMLRKKEQAANVKRKEQERHLQKERSLKGIEAKKKDIEAKEGPQYTGRLKKAVEDFHDATGAGDRDVDKANEPDSEDDADYYRKEVGQEPDEEMFSRGYSGSKGGSRQSDNKLLKRFSKGKVEKRGGKGGRDGGKEGRGGYAGRGRGGGSDRGRGGERGRGGDRGRGAGRRGGPGSSRGGPGSSRGNRGGFGGGRGGGNDRGRDRKDKKKKRPTQVFNSQGMGPDYKKGSGGAGSSEFRGVKGGKIKKKGR